MLQNNLPRSAKKLAWQRLLRWSIAGLVGVCGASTVSAQAPVPGYGTYPPNAGNFGTPPGFDPNAGAPVGSPYQTLPNGVAMPAQNVAGYPALYLSRRILLNRFTHQQTEVDTTSRLRRPAR